MGLRLFEATPLLTHMRRRGPTYGIQIGLLRCGAFRLRKKPLLEAAAATPNPALAVLPVGHRGSGELRVWPAPR